MELTLDRKQQRITALLAKADSEGLLEFVNKGKIQKFGEKLFHAESLVFNSIAYRIQNELPEVITELQEVDVNTKAFTANGKKFRVLTSLSTERYQMLERYQIEFGFGVSFKEMFDAWVLQYNLLQGDNKRADAAVNAYKVINGIKNVDENLVYAFQLCTLFICYEDEDVRFFDADLCAKKVEDWTLGAIDSKFFFLQAAISVTEFINVYKLLAESISKALSQ